MKLLLEFTRAQSSDDPFAFRLQPESYLQRTDGGGTKTFQIDWPRELPALIGLRDPTRGPELRQALGERMGQLLDDPDLCRALATAETEALQVVVRSAAAELFMLPWELMTVGDSGRALAELPRVELSYCWPETQTTPITPNPPLEGGRVLVVASDAGGAIPLEAQCRAIATAAGAGGVTFDPACDVIQGASLAALGAALERARAEEQPVRVLHVLAHGQSLGQGFALALRDGPADATALRAVLAPYADMVRCVVLSACDAGSTSAPGSWLGSIAQTLHRAGIATVIASRAPLSVAGSIGITETLYRALLVELEDVSSAVRLARVAELRAGRVADAAALQLHAREEDLGCRPIVFRPYRGLLPFSPAGSRFFVGRTEEIRALEARVRAAMRGEQPRFLVLSGPSASGKTSLVMGGLVPLLRQGPEPWEIRTMRMSSARAEDIDALRLPRQGPLLLVVDHLEDAGEGAAVVLPRLWALSQTPGGQVFVLVPLRIDLLGPLGALTLDPSGRRFDKVAYDPKYGFFLAQMSQEDLVQVIREPARRVGVRVDEGLIAAILSEVGDTPAPLPVLGVALDALWLRRTNDSLDPAVWRAMNGLSGALARTADEAWAALGPEEQRVARSLILRMVNPGEHGMAPSRRRVDLDAMGSPDPLLEQVLEHLIDARLVSAGDADADIHRGRWAELAHDALVRAWPRLRQWVDAERDKLAQIDRLNADFQAYQSASGPRARLELQLRGGRLADAVALARSDADLPENLRRWVLQCAQAEGAGRRRERLFAGLVAVLALMAALQMALLRERSDAERLKTNAEMHLRLIDTARARVAAGEDVAGLEAALRAVERSPDATPATREVLAGLLSELMHKVNLRAVQQGHSRAVSALVASPDGRRYASGALDGTVALWSMAGERTSARAVGAAVTALAFGADGQTVLVGTERGDVCRWRSTELSCADWTPSGRAVMGLAESADGRLWVATLDGRVMERDAEGGLRTLLEPEAGALNALAVAPDGSIAVGEDGGVRLRLPGGEVIRQELPGERAVSVAFRPGRSDQLAIASSGLRIWNRAEPLPPPRFVHLGGVRALAFTPDGRALVSLGLDDALAWHRMVQAPGRRLNNHRPGGTTLAVGAEGTLVSGDAAGQLLFRNVSPDFVRVVDGHKGPVVGAVWTGTTALVSASEDGRLLSITSGTSPFGEGVALTAVVADGADLVSARADGFIERWSPKSGLKTDICRASAPPRALALVPGGVAWAGEFGVVGLCTTGGERELLPPTAGEVATAMVADGEVLYVAFASGRLLRLGTGGTQDRLLDGGAALTAVALRGGRPVTGHSDGTLRLSETSALRLGGGPILDIDVRSDGLMAVACADGAVRLVRDDTVISTRALHEGAVRSVSFSPDGAQLATGGEDRTLRISPIELEDPAPWVIRALAWLGEDPTTQKD